jgi:murein DD-endopeptidase MepM/ murein hydrolase activator NlpD
VVAAVILVAVIGAVFARRHRVPDAVPPQPVDVQPPPESKSEIPSPSAFAHVVLPTPQRNLLDGPPETVFQPTAAGRIESAFYGSGRTGNSNGHAHPRHHEGLDIAPVARDRAGRALDQVYAAADGRVAYASRHAGNSNYGNYVVLLHNDPVGQVYTLYAHLAEVGRELIVGRAVAAGAVLGRMGNTPGGTITVQRSHLHFEVGLLANSRCDAWLAARKVKNPHGNFNGWNLFGCDPLRVLADQRQRGEAFSLLTHLAGIPAAFEIILPTTRLPDFFRRYPALWKSGPFQGPALVVAVSVGGVPLSGRAATAEEFTRCKGQAPAVLCANAELLRVNGRRIVASRGGAWVLGSQGQQWVDILLY